MDQAMAAQVKYYPQLANQQLQYNPLFSQQALGQVNNVAALLSGDPSQQYNLTPKTVTTGKGRNKVTTTTLEQTPTGMTAGNEYTNRADAVIDQTMMQGTNALIDTGDRINYLGGLGQGLSEQAARFAQGPTALDNQIGQAGSQALNVQADQVSMPDQIRNVEALNANAESTGAGALGDQLLSSAQSRLANNGQLSEEELRNASQGARGAFAARGLGVGSGAAAAEILNRAAFSRQRMNEDAAFAANVQAQDLSRRQANTAAINQFGLANQQVGMQAQIANQSRDQAMNQQRMAAQQSNQAANMNQLAANRDFLINSNNAVNNSQISRGNYGLGMLGNTSNIYGQGGGAYLNAAQLGYGGASALVNLDPMQRALGVGVNLGTSTNAQTGQMIGNTYNQALGMAGNVASFNTNMQASMYNSALNNNAATSAADKAMWGQIAGAGIGAIGKIGSAAAFCWVAREVYGEENPAWMEFRDWLLTRGSYRRVSRYAANGPRIAEYISTRPGWKARLRKWMDARRAELAAEET
jgi:hypothetical protein